MKRHGKREYPASWAKPNGSGTAPKKERQVEYEIHTQGIDKIKFYYLTFPSCGDNGAQSSPHDAPKNGFAKIIPSVVGYSCFASMTFARVETGLMILNLLVVDIMTLDG
ncbi:hypothetical protein [Aeromonas veronii]|uniref:hypothetical protein n=1 Tax=Aeromonas veronii TaxID=654 RepID=UPI0015E6F882|nr:hypothetical protein [Aeromonas veronii]